MQTSDIVPIRPCNHALVLVVSLETSEQTNNLKSLREIGWDCMDWINLAQDRDQWGITVYTVMNLRVP
jgi:hypothetical protein